MADLHPAESVSLGRVERMINSAILFHDEEYTLAERTLDILTMMWIVTNSLQAQINELRGKIEVLEEARK